MAAHADCTSKDEASKLAGSSASVHCQSKTAPSSTSDADHSSKHPVEEFQMESLMEDEEKPLVVILMHFLLESP